MITTPELQAQGLSVRVTHRRKMVHPSYQEIERRVMALAEIVEDEEFASVLMRVLGDVPAAKSGVTLAQVVDEDGNVLAVGEAPCSKQDNYDRRKGRTIAMGRALKHLREHAGA